MLSLQMCGMSVMDKRRHPRVTPAATPLLLQPQAQGFCSGLDSAPQMPRLILYLTLTAGSCKLLPTIAFSLLKSSNGGRICPLGLSKVRGCAGLVFVSLPMAFPAPRDTWNSELPRPPSRAAFALSLAMGNRICCLPDPPTSLQDRTGMPPH